MFVMNVLYWVSANNYFVKSPIHLKIVVFAFELENQTPIAESHELTVKAKLILPYLFNKYFSD
jgi:hypothetical protein